jgi:hypothetical protein
MLAEEWARAQEEEERYLSSRQERWREALARAAAAAEAGGEADDTDVEELMVSCVQRFRACLHACELLRDTAMYTASSGRAACSHTRGGLPRRSSLPAPAYAPACDMSGV